MIVVYPTRSRLLYYFLRMMWSSYHTPLMASRDSWMLLPVSVTRNNSQLTSVKPRPWSLIPLGLFYPASIFTIEVRRLRFPLLTLTWEFNSLGHLLAWSQTHRHISERDTLHSSSWSANASIYTSRISLRRYAYLIPSSHLPSSMVRRFGVLALGQLSGHTLREFKPSCSNVWSIVSRHFHSALFKVSLSSIRSSLKPYSGLGPFYIDSDSLTSLPLVMRGILFLLYAHQQGLHQLALLGSDGVGTPRLVWYYSWWAFRLTSSHPSTPCWLSHDPRGRCFIDLSERISIATIVRSLGSLPHSLSALSWISTSSIFCSSLMASLSCRPTSSTNGPSGWGFLSANFEFAHTSFVSRLTIIFLKQIRLADFVLYRR